MTDKDLSALRENAVRLSANSKSARYEAAARLLPLIDAEIAVRRERALAARPPKKTRARTTASAQ